MALIAFLSPPSCVYLMRPHWQENAQARIRRAALWRGSFDQRSHFDNGSSFERLRSVQPDGG